MSLGPVMLDIAGIELTEEDRELLKHPAVGGVILFSRNYKSPEQLSALTSSIRTVREPNLLIAVDQEGGRVQRFHDGFVRLPSAATFGNIYQQSPHVAQQLVTSAAWMMASELLAVGIDYSFAPVLDIDRGICKAIGDRAFSGDADIVSELALGWMDGARLAGMVSVSKHFPGHGGVDVDSHLVLPRDERSFDTLWREDLLPFRHLVNQGVEAVMPSHVVYSAVDEAPAGFSSRWLQDILRKQMGFQGVIISDALDMAAAEEGGSFVERSKAALLAGCDQLLVCNNRDAAIRVVDALVDCHDAAAQARLVRLYGRCFTPYDRLIKNNRWQKNKQFLSQCTDAETLSDLTYDPTTRGGQVV
jgi:beta-N-acetylhexosaminidase